MFLKAGCPHSAPSSGPGMEDVSLVAHRTGCTKQWGQEEEGGLRRASGGHSGAGEEQEAWGAAFPPREI